MPSRLVARLIAEQIDRLIKIGAIVELGRTDDISDEAPKRVRMIERAYRRGRGNLVIGDHPRARLEHHVAGMIGGERRIALAVQVAIALGVVVIGLRQHGFGIGDSLLAGLLPNECGQAAILIFA